MFRLKPGGADGAARPEIVDYEVTQPFRKNPAIMRMLLFLIFVYLLLLHILSIEQMRTILRRDSPPRIVYRHPAKLHFYLVPERNQLAKPSEDLTPSQLCAFIDAVRHVQPEDSHVYGFAVRLHGPLWNEAARWGAQWHSLNFTFTSHSVPPSPPYGGGGGDERGTNVFMKTLANVPRSYYDLILGTTSDEDKFASAIIVPDIENQLLPEEAAGSIVDRREKAREEANFDALQTLPQRPQQQQRHKNNLFHPQRRRLTLAKLQNLLTHGGVHIDSDTFVLNSTLLHQWQAQSLCLMSISWHAGEREEVDFSSNSDDDASVALPFVSCPQNSPYISSMLSRYNTALNFAPSPDRSQHNVGKSADRFLYRVAHSHLPYTATLLREVAAAAATSVDNAHSRLALLYVPRPAFSELERRKLRTLYRNRTIPANFDDVDRTNLFHSFVPSSSNGANRDLVTLSLPILGDFLFVYRLPYREETAAIAADEGTSSDVQLTGTTQSHISASNRTEFDNWFKRRHWKHVEGLRSCETQIAKNSYCA